MSSNKKIKNEMVRKFGKKCFIEELHLRTKKDVKNDIQRFTSKSQRCVMDELTYHHILEKCKRWQSNNRKWSNFKKHKSYMVSQIT